MIAKLDHTSKHGPLLNPHTNKSDRMQQIMNKQNRIAALERTAASAT